MDPIADSNPNSDSDFDSGSTPAPTSGGPGRINVTELFQLAALEVNGKQLENLGKDTVISRLGLDSVAVMELVSYFEEKLDIRMPDEELAKVQTLGDLGGLVERLVPTGTSVTY